MTDKIERTDAAQAHFDRVAHSDAFKAPEQLIRADIDMLAWDTTRTDVPAEKPFYNGITAYENGYNRGSVDGEACGRLIGEAERVALATANGEMRTIIRQVRALVANNEPYGTILRYLSEAAGRFVESFPQERQANQ